jgi:small Trp-rich protein
MAFVLLGLLLLALKLAGLGFVSHWSWWLVLAPFALAAAWWALADALGYTQRDAMRRQDERVAKRRQTQLDAMRVRPGPGTRGRDQPPPGDR